MLEFVCSNASMQHIEAIVNCACNELDQPTGTDQVIECVPYTVPVHNCVPLCIINFV